MPTKTKTKKKEGSVARHRRLARQRLLGRERLITFPDGTAELVPAERIAQNAQQQADIHKHGSQLIRIKRQLPPAKPKAKKTTKKKTKKK